MTIRTQKPQIFGRVVSPITVYMVNFYRNPPRYRIALTPTAKRTFFAILFQLSTAAHKHAGLPSVLVPLISPSQPSGDCFAVFKIVLTAASRNTHSDAEQLPSHNYDKLHEVCAGSALGFASQQRLASYRAVLGPCQGKTDEKHRHEGAGAF